MPTLKTALDLVHRDPADVSEFLRIYGDNLRCRGEDETIPRNVTSLLSHSMLTGQFYRVLDQAVERLYNPLRLSLAKQEVTTVQQAETQWVGQFVRATVRFHQNPVRPKDLRVLQWLDYLQAEFDNQYRDHLLFSVTDTLWLFFAGRAEQHLAQALTLFTDAGFYVETESVTATLKDLNVLFGGLEQS